MDANKVRSSVKDFLEKMKACDAAIPEELAEDALQMAEEVADACACEDEEADVLEVTKDEDPDSGKDIEKKVEDAMVRTLRKYGLIQDTSTKALDELEKELEAKAGNEEPDKDDGKKNSFDADNEEAVTVDPNETKDSAQQMLAFIRAMKPTIASVKDARVRRKLSDQIVQLAKLQTTGDGQYAQVLDASKKAAAAKAADAKAQVQDADYGFGMSVAERFNPHYKKEG